MRTAAADLVTILYDEVVSHIFVNPGMMTVPLRAALAEAETAALPHPQAVLCVHEHVAVCAAHGHHLAGGGPQAVMVHVEGAPLKLGAALQNVARSRIPIALLLGATGGQSELALTDDRGARRVSHVGDEPMAFSAASKWEADLSQGGDLGTLVRRAFQVARAESPGLAQLTIPRECLREPAGRPSRRLPPPRPPAPDMAALEEMADLLATAERPLVAVGRVGRHPTSVHDVARLAETLGAPVIDFKSYVNLPPHHPLNAALEGRELLAEADAILLLDVEMPCLPGLSPLPPQAWLLQVDTDCLRTDLRNWACPVEIAITADTRLALPPLQALLADRLGPRLRQVQERRARAEAALQAMRQSWRDRAASGDPAAAADALLAELDRALPDDALILEESAAAGGGALRQLERPPGHFFRSVSSAGWALGAALGARLARPLQPVITVCDDSAFADGLPTATFWSAHREGAAFLTVVLDRDRRQKPRPSTRSRLPDGSDVIELARASGAETEVVSRPSEVAGAVERMLATTRDGVCAVLALKLPRQ